MVGWKRNDFQPGPVARARTDKPCKSPSRKFLPGSGTVGGAGVGVTSCIVYDLARSAAVKT